MAERECSARIQALMHCALILRDLRQWIKTSNIAFPVCGKKIIIDPSLLLFTCRLILTQACTQPRTATLCSCYRLCVRYVVFSWQQLTFCLCSCALDFCHIKSLKQNLKWIPYLQNESVGELLSTESQIQPFSIFVFVWLSRILDLPVRSLDIYRWFNSVQHDLTP